ncbi:alpha/beta-hydrolase [Laetiporus sulphureus 93-53]|uniref:Alpha/beta-hydrolase n=1 Tax=Laetiporus sulphureus 93-53 TaxID=1314785 RepID=A0A165EQT1_9APHY|nr:alpha/beta-hydrolase [Laetiporus sulphureus 93-53]KZT07566.1 alpha/beta-hydrolase [Laetiporus sulphureus 93-53]
MSRSNEQPFSISIPDAELELLHEKLRLARLPDELDEAGWAYGAPLADIRRLVEHWQSGYDWRKAEAEINAIPQFTRDIEVDGFGTLNIHYIHQRSAIESAVPLLFVHGWPGHFLEVRKLLPLLTEASEDHPSFHVVAISLPGYGWSEAPKRKGFKGPQYAEVANKLMLALGYNEYVAQGGDWGYFICRMLASEYGQKSVKAWHTNSPFTGPPSVFEQPLRFIASVGSLLMLPFSPADRAALQRTKELQEKGFGYFKEQSTQPQTLGYSLADSPVGLLAWIYEKLVTWTDNYPWDDDEVLTWISIYWFSRAGPAASIRIYFETTQNGDLMPEAKWSPIPLGISFFPKELVVVPKTWARGIGNVVFESDHDSGGHFGAHERPNELAADLRKLFGKGGPAFGVVPGATGYA